jgi:hypothetical protein
MDSRATAGESTKRKQFVAAFEAEMGEATAAASWRRRLRQRQEVVVAIWLRWKAMSTAILRGVGSCSIQGIAQEASQNGAI